MSLVTQPSTTPSTSSKGSPSTPIRAVTSPTGFVFPAIWSFPPFFTLQPNPSTLAHQLSLWSNLFLSWATYHRVFVVNVDKPEGEVFENKAIRRRLQGPGLRSLMGHMAKEGLAALDPPTKNTSTYLLYWRKPDEWGTLIYDWVMGNGFGNSILTFWELTEGDLVESTDFRGLPPSLLRKALDVLVKRGKAQIIKGEGEAGEGARFF